MIPSSIESLLARGLILWPARRSKALGFPSRPLSESGAEQLMHSDPFMYRYAARHIPSISDTDLRQRLLMYVGERNRLAQWHEDAVARESIGISWRDAQPIISTSQVSRWLSLTNEFDADVLLAFDFINSRAGGTDSAAKLKNWRTVARCSDFDLERLLAKGVSDLHIHVGGVRLQQSIWLRLMDNPDAIRRYPQLARAYAEDDIRSWSAEPASKTPFADEIRQARDGRTKLAAALGLSLPEREHPQTSGDRWWSWNYSALDSERMLLVAGWAKLLGSLDDNTGHHLDQYCALKHRFSRIAKQPIFEAPVGLKYFSDRYFRRLERREGDERARQRDRALVRHRDSHRFTMEPTANACAFVLESPPLRKVELRIAPMARAPDYWRYFQLWNRFKEKQLDPWLKDHGREPVQIGFAVHFKRGVSAQRRSKTSVASTTHQRLIELDRETSELRIALSCPERSLWMRDLRRIDVAGNEREAHSAFYGFHLRLLRGEAAAVKHLEWLIARTAEDDPFRPFIGRWERVARRGLLRQDATEPRLGLTMHAGEDYADQLEGLYQIAGAIDCCGMEAGDAIGHGLALAPGAERQTNPNTASIGIAASLASLCWLHDVVQDQAVGPHQAAYTRLREEISDLARRIGDPDGPAPAANDVVEAWRMTFFAGRTRKESARFPAAERITRAFVTPKAALRSEKYIDASSRRFFDALTEIARQRVCAEVIRRRVVVEMNPSSNTRISGSEDPSFLPTVHILQMINEGLVACVNTDNPGVFATCIENEYAVLMDSAREARAAGAAHLNEREIRDLIERAREAGMASVYWR